MSRIDYPNQDLSQVRNPLRGAPVQSDVTVYLDYPGMDKVVRRRPIPQPELGTYYASPVCAEQLYDVDGEVLYGAVAQPGFCFALASPNPVMRHLKSSYGNFVSVLCLDILDANGERASLPAGTAVWGVYERDARHVFDPNLKRGQQRLARDGKRTLVRSDMCVSENDVALVWNHSEVIVLSEKPIKIQVRDGIQVDVYPVISLKDHSAGYVLAEHLQETGAVATAVEKVRDRYRDDPLISR